MLLPILCATVLGLAPGDHRVQLAERSYVVHVPPSLKAAAPLVIALHGGRSNAENQQRYSGMDVIADRESFIVVYPNAADGWWNADDVAFIRAVVDDVAKRVAIDRHRIYATGFSNGAIMAYRLASEAPDLVVAITAVAGAIAVTPSPVSVLHIQSVDDERAPYSESHLTSWVEKNGCVATARTEKKATATKLVWDRCKSGRSIVLWQLRDTGHNWPTRNKNIARLLARPIDVIDASEEAWSFFSSAGRLRSARDDKR